MSDMPLSAARNLVDAAIEDAKVASRASVAEHEALKSLKEKLERLVGAGYGGSLTQTALFVANEAEQLEHGQRSRVVTLMMGLERLRG